MFVTVKIYCKMAIQGHSRSCILGSVERRQGTQCVEDVASESPKNRRFRLPHCRLTPRLQGTPANIRITLTLLETTVIVLQLCLIRCFCN